MIIDSAELIRFFEGQINQLRTNPRSLIPVLQQRLDRFYSEHSYFHKEISALSVKTVEGKHAVKEAIDYLEQMHLGTTEMVLSQVLCEVAFQVGAPMAKQVSISDINAYSEQLQKELVSHFPSYAGSLNLIVEYGFRKDAEVVASIIIDDGDNHRTRRELLLDSKNKYLGVGVHQHSEYDYILLFLLADKPLEQPKSVCAVM